MIGGTVPVVNIDGVKAGELKLSGPVLADIFMGKIKKWDDDRIKEMNHHLKLPKTDIIVVHRSDGSGTTFGWTNYLSKVSPSGSRRWAKARPSSGPPARAARATKAFPPTSAS